MDGMQGMSPDQAMMVIELQQKLADRCFRHCITSFTSNIPAAKEQTCFNSCMLKNMSSMQEVSSVMERIAGQGGL